MISGEATHTNYIIFGLIWLGFKLITYKASMQTITPPMQF